MSLLKSEAKLSAVNELGSRLDDVLENANKDLQKEEGAVTALKNAVASLDNLLKMISKELDDKLVDLETQVLIKKYFDKARATVTTMAAVAENSRQAQVGKIAAFQQAVGIAKKYRDEEFRKFSAMKSAIEKSLETQTEEQSDVVVPDAEAAEPGRRPVGVRPPPPIKMQRLIADAVAESAVSVQAVTAPPAAEEPPQHSEEPSASHEETEEAEATGKKSKKQKK